VSAVQVPGSSSVQPAGPSPGRLLAAEVLKFRTTRTPLVLLGVAIALQLIVSALTLGLSDTVDLAGEDRQVDVLVNVGVVGILMLVLGAVNAAGEHRHRTITAAYLIVPKRWPVQVTKLVVHAIIGALLGVVVGLAVLLLAAVWLDARDIDMAVSGAMIGQVLGGWALSCGLSAALGVAIGALLRNQVAAIVIPLVVFFVLEPAIAFLSEDVVRFLPGIALTGTNGDRAFDDALPMLVSGLVALAYIVVLMGAAIAITQRRDVE
jgi:ABC-2 type transport system permease protein